MAAHLLPGGPGARVPRPVRAAGGVGLVAGVGLATAAALDLGADLTPAVAPRPGARLHTSGLYGLSRHPLYAGLLVASAGTTLVRGRASTVLAAVALATVLHAKALHEDRELEERFGEAYRSYSARVPRLLGLPARA